MLTTGTILCGLAVLAAAFQATGVQRCSVPWGSVHQPRRVAIPEGPGTRPAQRGPR